MSDPQCNIHVVIDRTGSMDAMKDETISGFNAYVDETKGADQRWWVWPFDSMGIDLIQEGVAAPEVEKLDEESYVPRRLKDDDGWQGAVSTSSGDGDGDQDEDRSQDDDKMVH